MTISYLQSLADLWTVFEETTSHLVHTSQARNRAKVIQAIVSECLEEYEDDPDESAKFRDYLRKVLEGACVSDNRNGAGPLTSG